MTAPTVDPTIPGEVLDHHDTLAPPVMATFVAALFAVVALLAPWPVSLLSGLGGVAALVAAGETVRRYAKTRNTNEEGELR